MKISTTNKWLLLLICLIVLSIFSLTIGKNALTLADIIDILQQHASGAKTLLFTQFRLPRLLVALLSGFGLAIAGFLLQGATQNDLADASLLGINAGAGLMVMFYLGFYSDGTQPWLLPIFACFGSLLSAFLVFFTSYSKKYGLHMTALLLSGIAVNAGLSALTMLLTIKIEKQSYQFVSAWLAGTLWGASWQYVSFIFIGLIICLPLAIMEIKPLELLQFGDDTAISLGVNVQRHRLVTLTLASLIAGISVSVAGNLSFVGLIAPHMSKRLIGKHSRSAFLLSGFLGSTFVLLGDTLGRVILPTGEIPAGILTAIIGAPYFIYMLIKK